MAILGTFTQTDTGFQGAIATLTLKAKVTIAAVEKTADKAPEYRVYAGAVEIGAAWSSTSKDGKAYLSVKLDDPSFAAPILARLVETDQGRALVWNR